MNHSPQFIQHILDSKAVSTIIYIILSKDSTFSSISQLRKLRPKEFFFSQHNIFIGYLGISYNAPHHIHFPFLPGPPSHTVPSHQNSNK